MFAALPQTVAAAQRGEKRWDSSFNPKLTFCVHFWAMVNDMNQPRRGQQASGRMSKRG
jgi:hypothetical protein